MAASCTYTFDPDEWVARTGGTTRLEEPWQYPHEQLEGTDRCLFHADPALREERDIDATDLREALLACLEAGGRGTREFVGARLRDLDLGARDVGDNKATSEFFRKAVAFRRKQYGRIIRGNTDRGALSRSRAVGRWLTNAFFSTTCGYGERPTRVLWVSFALIGVFSVFFAILGIDMAIVNLLTALEGFIGAFFIALFVFSLTRSLNR